MNTKNIGIPIAASNKSLNTSLSNKTIFNCIEDRIQYKNLSKEEKVKVLKDKYGLYHGKGKRKRK